MGRVRTDHVEPYRRGRVRLHIDLAAIVTCMRRGRRSTHDRARLTRHERRQSSFLRIATIDSDVDGESERRRCGEEFSKVRPRVEVDKQRDKVHRTEWNLERKGTVPTRIGESEREIENGADQSKGTGVHRAVDRELDEAAHDRIGPRSLVADHARSVLVDERDRDGEIDGTRGPTVRSHALVEVEWSDRLRSFAT
ncbi:BQ5605_C001g00783 [Microbotryum silenes-dioicae]|uniref:BQ5605_C001g00783 protein n=1 Tax=Microbotryum silenes-dioicae TaxID=796604 RepID=A0A2X0M4C9_9BASI|nr:BQ5605_C001g00783 [Microbotryum silenes-dioicae]